MNGDPYRTSQSADRRVINRSGQAAYRQAEESRPVDEPVKSVAKPVSAPRSSASQKQPSKRWLWVVLSIVLVLIFVGAGWFAWSSAKNANTGIDASKYQAVYLMNGQLYFGKLQVLSDTKLKLTNVYYLQTQNNESTDKTDAESAETTSNNVQLIKLSNAIYGPNDEMIISKDQVLYYQNLKSDSKASQLIESDK